MHSSRTKHITLLFFLRELVKSGKITTHHVATKAMLADCATKLPLTDSLRLEGVARTRLGENRADGSEFICCCGHNLGDGSGKDKGKVKTLVVEPDTGKAAPQKHSTCPLASKWDSQKVPLL